MPLLPATELEVYNLQLILSVEETIVYLIPLAIFLALARPRPQDFSVFLMAALGLQNPSSEYQQFSFACVSRGFDLVLPRGHFTTEKNPKLIRDIEKQISEHLNVTEF